MQIYFFSDSQLWKLDGDMLQNKAGIWKSNHPWKFTYKGDKMSIEDIKKKKVLGTTDPSGEFVKKTQCKKATAI